ncbi:MAG: DUF885 domain-containing protein [Acidimicrobiales bacterium]
MTVNSGGAVNNSPTGPISELADRLISTRGMIDPITSLCSGVANVEPTSADFSPDGLEQRVETWRGLLRELDGIAPRDRDEQHAVLHMEDWLKAEIGRWGSAEAVMMGQLMNGPASEVLRLVQALHPTSSDEWAYFAAFLSATPRTLVSLQQSLQKGLDESNITTLREAELLLALAEGVASTGPGGLLAAHSESIDEAGRSRQDVAIAITATRRAHEQFSEFLRRDYLPACHTSEGTGAERYVPHVGWYLQGTKDPRDVYERCWDEFEETRSQMRLLAHQLFAGKQVHDVVWMLDSDLSFVADSDRDLVRWFATHIDRMRISFGEQVFDIPAEFDCLEVRTTSSFTSALVYMVDPAEGFARPGVCCLRPTGELQIPLWRYATVANYGGFPGSHLQACNLVKNSHRLNRAQQLLFIHVHRLGWAHFAESLVDELGYFEGHPGLRLGYLQQRILRIVRVLCDVGFHLQLRLPRQAPLGAGETWSYQLAVRYLSHEAFMTRSEAIVEMNRFVGSPANSLPFKVGAWAWRDSYESCMRYEAASFDRREYFRQALSMSPLGTDHLANELSKIRTQGVTV